MSLDDLDGFSNSSAHEDWNTDLNDSDITGVSNTGQDRSTLGVILGIVGILLGLTGCGLGWCSPICFSPLPLIGIVLGGFNIFKGQSPLERNLGWGAVAVGVLAMGFIFLMMIVSFVAGTGCAIINALQGKGM